MSKPEKDDKTQLEDNTKPVEDVIKEASDQLISEVPSSSMPLLLKLIALFTLIGGLSIIEGSFSGIFTRNDSIGTVEYMGRLVGGLIFIIIAYGIVARQKWTIPLYGIVVAIGFFINPLFAIFPAIMTILLFLNRGYFYPFNLDLGLELFQEEVKKIKKDLKRKTTKD